LVFSRIIIYFRQIISLSACDNKFKLFKCLIDFKHNLKINLLEILGSIVLFDEDHTTKFVHL
jgi:hypothetical protein